MKTTAHGSRERATSESNVTVRVDLDGTGCLDHHGHRVL